MLPPRNLGGDRRFRLGMGSQPLQPRMVPGGAQLSGMFLATTVTLRVTGLPAGMPANLMVSAAGPPCLVMVASMIPPPCPEAVG